MITMSTFLKALVESGVIVVFTVVAGRYLIEKLLAAHKETLTAFREEMRVEREGHDAEVEKLREAINDVELTIAVEGDRTREVLSQLQLE